MQGGRAVAGAAALALSLLLAGCGQGGAGSGVSTGPARWAPQLEGTITAITPGAATRVTLSDVHEALTTDGAFHHYASMTITIGPGQWVGPKHWQAAQDAMDLFVGEAIDASPHHLARTIAGQPDGFSGIIRRIQGNRVTLQRVKFMGDSGSGRPIERLMPVLNTFRLAPYTVLFGASGSSMPASQLTVGQYVDGLWEGAVSHPIADQWTIFPSASAWGPLESPHYAHLSQEPPPASPSGGAAPW